MPCFGQSLGGKQRGARSSSNGRQRPPPHLSLLLFLLQPFSPDGVVGAKDSDGDPNCPLYSQGRDRLYTNEYSHKNSYRSWCGKITVRGTLRKSQSTPEKVTFELRVEAGAILEDLRLECSQATGGVRAKVLGWES